MSITISKNVLKKFIPVYLCSLLVFTFTHNAHAQGFEKLNKLNGHRLQVYFSKGAETKAIRIARQLDKVLDFYQKQIHFIPGVTLLILSPCDWDQYSQSVVYGMPHYTNEKTLIVASENNPFWNSFIPPLDNMPMEIAQQIRQTYTDPNGGLTMEPFFDLLAIHELGHAYHMQDSLAMQRNWMSELLVNIFLHSYIAENEPNLLPALTIFPKMVVSSTAKTSLRYTTLNDLEKNYNVIAQEHPRNYGWYQCRWHLAAGEIYDQGGMAAFKKLWHELKLQRTKLDDNAFATLLTKQVHHSVADVMLHWDKAN